MLHFEIRQLNKLVKNSFDGLDSKRSRAMDPWKYHLAQWKNVTHSKQISSGLRAPTESKVYSGDIFPYASIINTLRRITQELWNMKDHFNADDFSSTESHITHQREN